MTAMNLPGAQVATVLTSVKKNSGSYGNQPNYALTGRFQVSLDGLNLGNWSSCTGLGVTFRPDELREGGQYGHPWYRPGEVDYKEVTLERAMEATSSRQVQTLLETFVKDWVNWDGGSKDPAYSDKSVYIRLFDSQGGSEVAAWTLTGAVITSWSGPDLSGRNNQVALEKLTFKHQGFLSGASSSKKAGTTGKATKMTLSNGDERLDFVYNPDVVSVEQGVTAKRGGGATTFESEQRVTSVEDRTITINKIRLEGQKEVTDKVNKLLTWVVPLKATGAGPSGAATGTAADSPTTGPGEQETAAPRKLGFSLGGEGGMNWTVVLRKVHVDFTRFTSAGTPIRAEISLTLLHVPDVRQFLNPSSGGRSANRAHVVGAGDNLQRIAQSTYRDPNAWRSIAEANGIDDPLRVPNGNVLLLPHTADEQR